ncbi:hypothetical protein ACOMHN_065176 [Nucella lapillus]
MDDIFDDQLEEEYIAEKDWRKTENDIRKTGYRLGLGAGEEETIQQGFDAGYRAAVNMGFALGRLKGCISAILSVVESTAGKDDDGGRGEENGRLTTQLTDLLNDCAHLQQSVLSLHYTDMPVVSSPLNCPPPSTPHAGGPFQTNGVVPSHGPGPQTVAAPGDGVGQVTDLFTSMGVQDSPLHGHEDFSKCLGQLQQRYQILLECVYKC